MYLLLWQVMCTGNTPHNALHSIHIMLNVGQNLTDYWNRVIISLITMNRYIKYVIIHVCRTVGLCSTMRKFELYLDILRLKIPMKFLCKISRSTSKIQHESHPCTGSQLSCYIFLIFRTIFQEREKQAIIKYYCQLV